MCEQTRYVVELAIPTAELRRLYSGMANTVVALDLLTGLSVRFPASRLRDHVENAGVYGRFELVVSSDNRLQTLSRLVTGND